MSATVDERIVRMEFDNQDFEKNVATSLSTLDKLKNALGFTKQREELETLSHVVGNIKFDSMANSLEAIQDKFSAFGNFSRRIIENLADDIYQFGKKVVTAIPNQIVEGGWARATNVEQAKFNLKGLGIAWEEVSEDIDHAVLGTAYGADEAARAASQLAASGVAFGGVIDKAEDGTEIFSDMGRALRGISGVAAMTNSSYTEIANIFTKIAGNGKIMGNELQMLSSRGLNVAATMADVFNMTEEEVREMVHQGEIDFQMFADAMDLAFGEHATDANATFTGSLANMKSALSRIGEDYAKIIQQGMPPVFNSLKEFFNKIRKITRPIAENLVSPAFKEGMIQISKYIDKLTEKLPGLPKYFEGLMDVNHLKFLDSVKNVFSGVLNILSAVGSVISPILKAIGTLFSYPTIDSITNVTSAFKDFTESLILTDDESQKVYDVTLKVIDVLKNIKSVIEDVIYVLSPITKVLKALVDSGLKIITAIVDAFKKFSNDNSLNDFSDNVEDAHDAVDKFSDKLVDLIEKFTDFSTSLIDSNLPVFIQWIKDAIDGVKEFEERTGIISGTLQAIGTLIAAPLYVIGKLAGAFYDFGKKIYELEGTQIILGKISEKITEISKIGKEKFEKLVDYISKVDPEKSISNIKDVVGALWDKMRGFFDFLSEKVSVIKTIKNEIEKVIGDYKKLKGGVSAHTLYDETAKDYIDSLNEEETLTTEMLHRVEETGCNLAAVLADAFGTTEEKIRDMVANGEVSISDIKEQMEGSTTVFSGFKEIVAKAIEKVKEFFDTLDANKLIAVAFTISMAGMLIAVWKLVSSFTTVVTTTTGMIASFKNVGDSITGFFRTLTNTLNVANQKKGPTHILLEFAGAVALVTACLIALSYVGKTNDLWSAAAVLGAIAAGLLLFSFAMSKIANSMKKADTWKELATLDATLLAMSTSLLILAAAFKVIGEVDIKSAQGTILVMAEIALILVGVSFLLSKFTAKGLSGFLTLLAFAFVVKKFGEALSEMGKVNYKNISNNIESLIVIFIGLAAVSIAASHIGVFSAIGLFLLLTVLDTAMPKLQNILQKCDFAKIMELIRQNMDIITQLTVLAAFITAVSSKFGRGFQKFGIGMILLGASFILVGKAIDIMGGLSRDKVEQGSKVIRDLLLVFSLLALIGAIGGGKNGIMKIAGAIAVFSVCLYPLAGAIWILGTMDSKKVDQGTAAIESLMVCFGLMIMLANLGHKNATTFGTVLSIVIGLVLIVGEMIALTFIPAEQIITATIAICGVMLSFGKLLNSVAKIGNVKNVAGSIVQLIFTALLLAGLGYELYLLSTQPWEGILAAASSIALVLIAMSFVFDALSLSTATIGDAAAFLLMSLSLLPIGLALYALSNQPWDSMLAAAGSIALVLVAFAVVSRIISGMKVGAAVEGALALMAVIYIVSILALALAALASLIPEEVIPDIERGFDNLIMIASKFGDMIGAFIGHLYGSAVEGALTGIATGLSTFAMLSDYFIQWVKGIDESVVTGSANLAKALLVFSASEFISGLLSMGSIFGDLSFIKSFYVLGTGVKSFCESIEGLDTSNVDAAAGVARALFSLKAPNQGGLISSYIGDNNFSKFGPLTLGKYGLGGGIKAFADEVYGITESQVSGGIKILQALFSLDPPNQGGLITSYIGDNNFSKFGPLTMGSFGLGGGVKEFAEQVYGISYESVSGGVKLLQALFALDPPNQGGLISALTGDNNFGKFNVKALGEKGLGGGVRTFAEQVYGISEAEVSGGIKILQALFALDPPNQGGIISKIIGDNNFSKFGPYTLGNCLGGGIRAFADKVSGMDFMSANMACVLLDNIFSLTPPNQYGLINLYLGDNNYAKFNPVTMGSFGLGGGVRAFADEASQIKDFVSPVMACMLLSRIFSLDAPVQGGIIAFLLGDNSYKKFGPEMLGENGIGGGIKAFANSVSGIEDDGIEKARSAAQILTILDTLKIKKDGGLMGLIGLVVSGSKEDAMTSFINKLTGLGKAVSGFYGEVSGISGELLSTVVDCLDSIYKMLSTIEGFDVSKIANFTEAMHSAGDLGVTEFCNALTNAEDKIDAAIESFMNSVEESMNKHNVTFENSGQNSVDAFLNTIMGKNAFDMPSINSQSNTAYKVGAALPSSEAEGILSEINKVVSAGGTLTSEQFDSLFKAYGTTSVNGKQQAFFNLGEGSTTSQAEGMLSKIKDLTDAEGSITDAIDKKVSSDYGMDGLTGKSSSKFNMLGQVLTSSAADGMNASDVMGKLNDAIDKITGTVDDGINGPNSPMSADKAAESGRNYLAGINRGLNDSGYRSRIVDSCNSIAREIDGTVRKGMDINSPSKVAEETSKFIMMGYAYGIDDNTSMVLDSVRDFTDDIYDQLRSATDLTSEYVSENMDLDYMPVITPYIDMSGVRADAQNLNSLFENGQQITVNSKLGAMTDMMGNYANAQTAGSTNIVNAINSLTQDVRMLYNVVGNLTVVMDSGTLVGAIAPDMDQALGQMTMLKGRGV